MNVIGLKLFNRHFLILIACISSSYQFTNIVTVHINLSDKVHAIYLLNQSVPPNITKDMVTFGTMSAVKEDRVGEPCPSLTTLVLVGN